ncbi:MAG: threonylcarbamoyl-AMP synthase [Actinobacteria bacterium]|nr:threonylcarbamoyl-AMP synthase [Actinomycetota bacterium]
MRLDGHVRLTIDPREAALALLEGHLAALPTETVYGLGARADLAAAVSQVYSVKGRPTDHPLIVHIAGGNALDSWGESVPRYARTLADALWPGPLTLVVRRSPAAADFVTGGQDSVALRVSAHPIMGEVLAHLMELTGNESVGIAAPSANRFGRVSPTSASHVVSELADFLSDDDVVLDGGACGVGLESTIIDCTSSQPRLLRPGAITADDVARLTGLECPAGSTIRASGTLAKHYQPSAAVRIVEATELPDRWSLGSGAGAPVVGLIAMAGINTPLGILRLASLHSAEEYARVLYAALREADVLGLETVLAVAPEPAGIGAAVIDRLTRAAHSG